MKKILFYIVTILIVNLNIVNSQSKENYYGEEFSVLDIKDYSSNKLDFLNNPENKIRIEGEVLSTCPMKGCWIEIKDYDSNQIIRVKVKDDVIVFPQDAKTKKAIVKGIFTKINFSEEQAIKWKIHLAEEKGIKINESDVTLDSSDLIEYRIKGLGAKIITNLN